VSQFQSGFFNEVEIFIKIPVQNKAHFLTLLKEYGSRNLGLYQLGFDRLNTLVEVLEFLQYHFYEDQHYLVIDRFYGSYFKVDSLIWKNSARLIDYGYFRVYYGNQPMIDLNFELGRLKQLV